MQGFWSLGAQSHRHQCRASIQSANAIASRPGRILRRRPRFSEVFTACYTSIIARAAALGSQRWGQRREKLEEEILQAKEELARLRGTGSAKDMESIIKTAPVFALIFDGTPQPREHALHSLSRWKAEFLLREEEISKARGASLLELREGLPATWRTAPPSQTPATDCLVDLEEILSYEARASPALEERHPKNELQMQKASDAVCDMVDRLLRLVYEPEKGFALDSGWNYIRMLKNEGYPRYQLPTANQHELTQSRVALNEANGALFGSWAQRARHVSVSKICYNLLVASHLPGIHVYNGLMFGLAALGDFELAEVVVQCYLKGTHLYPTPGTVQCLLHHYRLARNVVGFYGIIRRMSGHDERGLLRRLIVEQPGRLRRFWINRDLYGNTRGFVVERTPVNQPILETLFRGLIELGRGSGAARIFVVCLERVDEAINLTLLDDLLRLCLYYVDHLAARILMEGILHNINRFSSLVFCPLESYRLPKRLVARLELLVDMCDAQIMTSMPTRRSVRHFAMSTLESHPMNYVRFRQRVDAIVRLKRNILVDRKLRKPLSEISLLLHQVEHALKTQKYDWILARFNLVAEQQAADARLWPRSKLSHRILWVDEEMEKSATMVKRLHHKCYNSIAPSVNRRVRSSTLFRPRTLVEVQLARDLEMREPGTWLNRFALVCELHTRQHMALRKLLFDALPQPIATALHQEYQMDYRELSLRVLVRTWSNYLKVLQGKGVPRSRRLGSGP